MQEPKFPLDESARLAALLDCEVLDTPPEASFDELTRLASLLCGVPIALVSLIDRDRQWFKSRVGLEAEETPRNISFCGHAILQSELLEVPDTLEDVRFCDNPLVVGPPRIRYYAGMPLRTAMGYALGTLCVIDTVPGRLDAMQREALQILAGQVSRLLESRLLPKYIRGQQAQLQRHQSELEILFDISTDGIAIIDLESNFRFANAAYQRLTGYSEEELLQTSSIAISAEEDRAKTRDTIQMLLRQGQVEGFDKTYVRKNGSHLVVDLSVALMPDKAHVLLNARDVTYKRLLEHELHAAKEKAEVTLAAIGDAVITTDADGRVNFLNPVAEKLTGWSMGEALHLPLETIFNILDGDTRCRIETPVEQVLREGKTVHLANHALLVARDGTEYHIENSAAPIFRLDKALIGCVLVFHDVTEKFRLLDVVSWQAGHDALTSLPNRALLSDRFARAIARTQRQQCMLAVCMLDLDGFKPINDRHGHEAGDHLLVEISRRLSMVVRGDDTVARLGGDEFVLLFGDLDTMDQLEGIFARLLEVIAVPCDIGGETVQVTASVGVAIYPIDNEDPDTLLRHADQAMYTAKQRGRNQYQLFDVSMDLKIRTSNQIVTRVSEALRADELVLYYQPKVDMRSGNIFGMEALLRWQHPSEGMIPPGDFLPALEDSDLIVEVGDWVLEQALRQIAEWSRAGKDWVVSVNIAARHFQKSDFLTKIKRLLARYPEVMPQRLELEILESTALGDMGEATHLIRDCQALGLLFSLDDFGTGYSSLSYLKRLQANTIKIDQSFVRDIPEDKDDLALVEAIIGMSRVFNRKTVAEGVETVEQGVLLLRLGCDLAQGYGIARPMPAERVLDWARDYVPEPLWTRWADVQWELNDFPLLVAQQDHVNWVKTLVKWLEHRSFPLSKKDIDNEHLCRFGQWYDGPGQARYGHIPTFCAIAPLHHRVHELGAALIQAAEGGQTSAAGEICAQLQTSRDEIVAKLMALQQEIYRY